MIHLADICIARTLPRFGLHLAWTWAARISSPSAGRTTIVSYTGVYSTLLDSLVGCSQASEYTWWPIIDSLLYSAKKVDGKSFDWLTNALEVLCSSSSGSENTISSIENWRQVFTAQVWLIGNTIIGAWLGGWVCPSSICVVDWWSKQMAPVAWSLFLGRQNLVLDNEWHRK